MTLPGKIRPFSWQGLLAVLFQIDWHKQFVDRNNRRLRRDFEIGDEGVRFIHRQADGVGLAGYIACPIVEDRVGVRRRQ